MCVLFGKFSWQQTLWRFGAVSSAALFGPSGNSSCSLWKSGLVSGTLASPGVQPCTPAQHNVARHSRCGLSSVQPGRPRRLSGCGHGVKGMPSCFSADSQSPRENTGCHNYLIWIYTCKISSNSTNFTVCISVLNILSIIHYESVLYGPYFSMYQKMLLQKSIKWFKNNYMICIV